MEDVEWTVLDISGEEINEKKPMQKVILANIGTFSNSILGHNQGSKLNFSFCESLTLVDTPGSLVKSHSLVNLKRDKSILSELEKVQNQVSELNKRISVNLQLLNSNKDPKKLQQVVEQEIVNSEEYETKMNEKVSCSCAKGCFIY